HSSPVTSSKPLLNQPPHRQPPYRPLVPSSQHPLHVLRQNVALHIHRVTQPHPRNIRVLVGEGNHGHLHHRFAPPGHRQADPVERDRAFHRHVARQFFRHANPQPPVRPFLGEPRHTPHSVHVPLHKMPSEFFA